jgi:hypothetical protein
VLGGVTYDVYTNSASTVARMLVDTDINPTIV